MFMIRRQRDETGSSIYYHAEGGGIVSSIMSKLTGETAKRLATKAVEKGVEQIGSKTGQALGEAVYDKIRRPQQGKKEEVVGMEIQKMLSRDRGPQQESSYAARFNRIINMWGLYYV